MKIIIKLFVALTLALLLQTTYAQTPKTCLKLKQKIAEISKTTSQVLINATIVKPSSETDDSFQKKVTNKTLGHLILVNDEIQTVVEGPGACKTNLFKGYNVTNLKGKFIIPGLHDLHVHNYGMNSDLPNSAIVSSDGSAVSHLDFPGIDAMNYRMLYSGVTTYLDLVSYNEDTMAQRDYQRKMIESPEMRPKGFIPGSNIYMSGGLFTFKTSHHGDLNWLVGDQKETVILFDLETIVLEQDQTKRKAALYKLLKKHIAKYSPKVLKISYDHNPHRPGSKKINGLPKAVLMDFVSIAKEIEPNSKVICHVGIWQDVIDCMDAGVAAITHLPFSNPKDPTYSIPEGIFKKMKDYGLFVITTMTTYMEGGMIKENLFNVNVLSQSCTEGEEKCFCINTICKKTIESGVLTGSDHFFNDPLLKNVAPKKLLDHYFDFNFYSGNPWIQWGVEHNKLGYRQKTFKQMMHWDVPVLSGTDTMWEGTFFGFSLHRELELMNLSNLITDQETPLKPISNMSVLATSTSKIHDFLNHYRGQLKTGFKADLVVLNASPIDDINNTRDIHSVYVNGIYVDRETLRKKHMGL